MQRGLREQALISQLVEIDDEAVEIHSVLACPDAVKSSFGARGARCAMSDSTAICGDRRAELRRTIVACARTALGTPFLHQGRQPGRGLDCAGLVLWVGHALGLTDFELTNYPRLPEEDRLLDLAARAGFIETRAPRPGDVHCLRLLQHPQHLAIATEAGIIHACQRRGQVIEHRLDTGWRARIVASYRYPGVI